MILTNQKINIIMKNTFHTKRTSCMNCLPQKEICKSGCLFLFFDYFMDFIEKVSFEFFSYSFPLSLLPHHFLFSFLSFFLSQTLSKQTKQKKSSKKTTNRIGKIKTSKISKTIRSFRSCRKSILLIRTTISSCLQKFFHQTLW